MIDFGPGKDINLALAGKHLGQRYEKELLKQNERARGLWRRLYGEKQPGVLLADEVGKGKTYIALAVAFALLAKKKNGRVLVLTHSGNMAKVWKDRWQELKKCVSEQWEDRWGKDGWTVYSYRSTDDLSDDSDNDNLPHIAFASYETLKKYGSEEEDAINLFNALRRAKTLIKLRFSKAELRALVKDILDCDLRSKQHKKMGAISDIDARRILRCLDSNTRSWKDGTDYEVKNVLDHMQAKTQFMGKARFDLLIVDEAHKLEGTARHRVVARLLHKRFNKCILVTATPFALSVSQFRRRLLDFRYGHGAVPQFEKMIKELPLDDFRKAVDTRAEYAKKSDIEKQLRQYMVRASWDHDRERTITHWNGETSSESIVPTLLLERLIDSVLQSGQRTHIASRRESLCSSWLAARKSLGASPLKGVDRIWSSAFDAVVKGSTAYNDPKLRTAVDKIVELMQQDTKVVVFTQRLETSKALNKLINNHPIVQEKKRNLEKRAQRLRRHVEKIGSWLDIDDQTYATGVVKVMAHSAECPRIDRNSVRKWWRQHKKQLGDGDPDKWTDLKLIIGRGRRLPLVVRHDAEVGSDERNIDKFNRPSSPLVLIATPKAQEGIDLHHYCRHVVLFDLTWNPAAIEQRIGRVHRLGGVRKGKEKVVVVYCFQKGTYEQVMAKRVQQRCEMMRVLLGAGQWLDEDREVKELDKYKMSFPP